WGNAHPNLVPYELFHASDRPIVIAVGNDGQFAALVGLLGVEELRDPRYAGNTGRVAGRERLVSLVRSRTAERPAEEWLAKLRHAGVPSGRVNRVEDALASVQTSPLTAIAPQPPGRVRRPPPRLDEHGELIRRHGWDAFAHA